MYRLGRHFINLERQIHDNSLLHQDWLAYGPNAFVFQVVESGSHLRSLKARILCEFQAIQNCKHQTYNTKKPLRSTFRKEWVIDGVLYSSGAEAARSLGLSTSEVYRLMKRKGRTRLISNTKRISVDGQEFESLFQAQSTLKVAKSTLYRRLRSETYPTWFYVEKTRSNDYPERE